MRAISITAFVLLKGEAEQFPTELIWLEVVLSRRSVQAQVSLWFQGLRIETVLMNGSHTGINSKKFIMQYFYKHISWDLLLFNQTTIKMNRLLFLISHFFLITEWRPESRCSCSKPSTPLMKVQRSLVLQHPEQTAGFIPQLSPMCKCT